MKVAEIIGEPPRYDLGFYLKGHLKVNYRFSNENPHFEDYSGVKTVLNYKYLVRSYFEDGLILTL